VTKLRDQVRAFHLEAGAPILETPTVPPDDRVKLRLKLAAEEFCELLTACGCGKYAVEDVWDRIRYVVEIAGTGPVDIVAVADALADLDFVNEGMRLEFGIDGEPIADEVARSNMSKFPTTVRADGKILKGPHYSPPDLVRVLREQGWSE